jgi:hypothetical protein|tara:strand:+ start:637 stop:1707 length:1071 start_codon:yes stop_codon:yes gene_type:complete
MPIYKNIEPENVLISSFKTYKTFTFTEVDSGSGLYAIPIIKGTDSNLYNFSTGTADSKTISASVFYKVPTYHNINQLYYKDITNIRGYIDYINGVPTSSKGVVEYISTDELDNTALPFRRPYTRQLHNTGTVIAVPQKFYGECIQPSSIRLTDNSTDVTYILQDDGRGNIYDVAYSSSYASKTPDANYSGSVIGNVFYNDGLIVITNTGSYTTVGTGTGADGFTLKFNSTQTIYEREYVCVVDENEYQHTTNKSLKVGYSSSVAMGPFKSTRYTNTVYDKFPYRMMGWSTSSYNTNGYNIGKKLLGVATHSEFATYVTSIGLYNDERELLAIGKLTKPVKNEKELALTFVVRFDTN